jgi:PKD repeat protein
VRRGLSLLCVAALGASLLAAAPAGATPDSRSGATAAEAVPDQLVVGYAAGATAADRDRARGRASAQRQERVVEEGADRREVELVRLPRGKSTEQAIAELQSDPAVAYAEPNWVYTHAAVTDPYYLSTDPATDLWGMYGDGTTPANAFGSQAGEAWAAGETGSAQVLIGVIDEGIQLDHPDLAGQVWINPHEPVNGVDDDGNGYVDDVNGWDFDGGDSTIYDGGTRGSLDDHGTHVAGTIGAKADGQGVVGVNHATTLISGKFLGRRGGTLSNAVKAVDYFTDLKQRHGLDIVATNNSWGGGGFSQSLLDAILRADQAGILFVAAAGNNGGDNDATPSYPSGYDAPNVIAVAATDRLGGLASFSQYGAQSVDLGAPGVGIWSTTAFNGWSKYDGTSMATPHVTGALALYAAARPGTSAADLKSALLTGTAATPSLTGKTATGGRLDISRMLQLAPPPTSPAVAPVSSFTSSCSGLACTFTDTSTGAPTSWAWSFGDGTSSATQSPSHTFAAAGTYDVELTVTNAEGTSTSSQAVTVAAMTRTVSATAGTKTKNVTPVTVRWQGFTSDPVTVSRNGQTFTTENDGLLEESWRGSGTLTYTVCESNGTECASAQVTI